MAEKWLVERWNNEFFPALTVCTTESEVKAVCEAEREAWSSRVSGNSMRNQITSTHKEINARLTGELAVWTWKHINNTSAEWDNLNSHSLQNMDDRLGDVQHIHIDTVPTIIDVAVNLLSSSKWSDVSVGLLVLTGRRDTEVLKTAVVTACTGFSVMFSGQLKKRDGEFPAYEVPTLCKASLVVDAIARLRKMLPDVQNMTNKQVAGNKGKQMADSARKHFAHLIPTPDDSAIRLHVFRTIYTRIAVYLFCPPKEADLRFLAYTQGHFGVSPDGDIQRSYASEINYYHYKLVETDKNGNEQICGHQGTWLDRPGVSKLAYLQRGKKPMTPTTARKIAVEVETPVTLVSTPERIEPMARKQATVEPTSFSLENLTPESLLPADIAQAVRVSMQMKGKTDFYEFLKEVLAKEAESAANRSNRFADKDFSSMSDEQLLSIKSEHATAERVRRGVAAIDAYNDRVTQMERWFINPSTLIKLVSCRSAIVAKFFAEHQEEIDEMNEKYNLTQKYNNKPISVKESVIKS